MKKWLFFDVGSTLIDETECEKQRIIAIMNFIIIWNIMLVVI